MENTAKDPRDRILLAARSLFAEKGFEGTTIRQICERAEVNQALVSYYFGGKENLYAAIVERFVAIRQDLLEAASREEPVTVLKLIVQQVIHWRFQNPEIVRIAQREMLAKNSRSSGVMTRVVPLWEGVKHVLQTGRQQGCFRFESLDYALMLVMGSLMYPNSYPLHDLLQTEDPVSEELVLAQTLQFVLQGLGYTGHRYE